MERRQVGRLPIDHRQKQGYLILAISIGANTTVFQPGELHPAPAASCYSLREENRIFDEVGAHDTTTLRRSGSERAEQLDASRYGKAAAVARARC